MSYSSDLNSIFSIDVVDSLAQQMFKLTSTDELEIVVSRHLGPLKETRVIIQLVDRSDVYPRCIMEDVLVQVNQLVFLVNFYMLDMEDEESYNATPILLCWPFLKIGQAMIQMHKRTLTMEFNGEIIKFNQFEVMRCPDNHDDELESPLEALNYTKG